MKNIVLPPINKNNVQNSIQVSNYPNAVNSQLTSSNRKSSKLTTYDTIDDEITSNSEFLSIISICNKNINEINMNLKKNQHMEPDSEADNEKLKLLLLRLTNNLKKITSKLGQAKLLEDSLKQSNKIMRELFNEQKLLVKKTTELIVQ